MLLYEHMPNNNIVPVSLHKDFESIKKVDENGFEYWEARELMPLLGYAKWQKFQEAILRAKAVCVSTQQAIEDHFTGAGKMVDIGSNTKRKLLDYHLSRFACYLVAQNGDPRKPEIAFAQTYFAVQTRKQELFEMLDDDGKRMFIRQDVSHKNVRLAKTAKAAGVENFGKFNNAGYLGLYNLTQEQIKKKKGIAKGDLLDYAGSEELAANLFRITQTDALLKKDNIRNEEMASATHRRVGRIVRETIEKLDGTMPEDLPAEEHIHKLVQKKVKLLPRKKK